MTIHDPSPSSSALVQAPAAPPRRGVVLSAHGTVDDVADIPAFLAIIRRGRPTPDHIIKEVVDRFQRIGGSPLLRHTREQAAALAARLGVPVLVGMRLWKPTLDDALEEAAAAGLSEVVSLPLAPQSVQIYHAALQEAAARRLAAGKDCPRIVEVAPWGEAPALLASLAECVAEGLAALPDAVRGRATLVLSAHSLPQRIVAAGDPYETQFRALTAALMARLPPDVASRCVVAFQSQGMDGGDWLGPDLAQVFGAAKAEGREAIVVCPVGFVADHVETLYDLDIEARANAAALGLAFARAPAPNARASFVEALAEVVRPHLENRE